MEASSFHGTMLRRTRTALCSVLVALLGVSAFAGSASAGGDSRRHGGQPVGLRVATYNIHAGAGEDGVFDLNRQVEAIRSLRADVIGLQEVDVAWGARSQWRDLAAELAKALHMHVFIGPIYDLDPATEGGPRRRYGNAILSRHPIVSAENHEITRLSTQTADPVPAPAPGFPEAVVQVRGTKVHVYATHLDYRPDPSIRAAQIADMKAIMAEDSRKDRPANQILLGDFNAVPTAPELAPLWTALTDAWTVGGTGSGPTYPAIAPDRRIDYIAVSAPVRVRSVRVPATEASDHRPVVADLTVRASR